MLYKPGMDQVQFTYVSALVSAPGPVKARVRVAHFDRFMDETCILPDAASLALAVPPGPGVSPLDEQPAAISRPDRRLDRKLHRRQQ